MKLLRSRAFTTAGAVVASIVVAGSFAPAARAADDAAAPAVEKVTVKAVAHFGFNHSAILPQDQAKILADVGKMQGVTWQTVTATGHTDNVGDPTYNEKLSARRADAVKAYLVGKGLDAKMISTTAQGEANPVADNGSPTGRAQNRRTEVEFQGVRATSK